MADTTSTTPQAGLPVEANTARAEIDNLRADPGFRERFASGDKAARDQLHDLHVQAYPEGSAEQAPGAGPVASAEGDGKTDAGDPPEGAPPEGAPLDISLPFTFAPDVPVAQMKQVHALGQEVVKALALEPESAAGAIKMIENAINARPKGAEGQPVPMDALEINRLEFLLHEKWGADYQANADAFGAALQKAGQKGGAWLQRSLLASGPDVAAAMMANLARRMRGGA